MYFTYHWWDYRRAPLNKLFECEIEAFFGEHPNVERLKASMARVEYDSPRQGQGTIVLCELSNEGLVFGGLLGYEIGSLYLSDRVLVGKFVKDPVTVIFFGLLITTSLIGIAGFSIALNKVRTRTRPRMECLSPRALSN